MQLDSERGARRCRWAVFVSLGVALAVALPSGCSGAIEPAASSERRLLEELERLAFVPRGRTPREAALDIVGSDVDLLVDRFEVTRAHWMALLGADRPPWGDDRPSDLPATHVTLEEALRFAGRRGMRLPTLEEWLWCAVGPRASAYPYGRPQFGIANTKELELGRPTSVGTFEQGKSPDTGLFDLHGNVRELTYDGMSRPASRVDDEGTLFEIAPAAIAHAAGSSFDLPLRPTFGRVPRDFVLAEKISGDARLADVGLRCVVDARAWLVAHHEDLSRTEWRAAIEAVGARWGARATTLLTELVDKKRGQSGAGPGSAEALEWLLEGAR